MRITQAKNVAVITIVTACVLATALWLAGATGHAALPRLKDKSAKTSEAPMLSALAAADEPAQLRANEAYGKLPLSFEMNQGQTDARVKFLSRGAGYNLFLTSTEAVLSLQPSRAAGETRGGRDKASVRAPNDVLRMKLVGANPTPKIEGSDLLPGKSNYFIGNDPKKWRTNVSTFARVHYREVYPGVDVVYYGNQRQLENDFIVAPGTNPGVIALRFDGANKISVDEDGSLVLGLKNGASGASGDVRLQKPVIYQMLDGVRHEVAGNYVLKSPGDVGFEVAAYDLTKPLVIDPVLVYSTYLGGNNADRDWAIAVDDSGNAYVTGTTASTDFPGATPPQHGLDDVTVVKFNAAGSALLYSTYLGGSSSEFGADIAVDGAGNAYVTGQTSSNDFPTVNAFDSTLSFAGGTDAFVTRLNPAGSALVYSTYLSGQFGARGWGIAVNNQNFAFVTGTTSVNFPVTSGAFESTNFNSGFMTKLCTNCSGASSLVYSTFLAHTGSAEGRAIAADVASNVYVTGNTNSTATDFASAGAFQTTYGLGSSDAFVEKFNTNLSGAASRVYCTYLGGSGKDIGSTDGNGGPGKAIAIDASGNAYITGSTASTNFPLANASQGAIGGQNDAFLTKLNATGSSLIYSTYLGGTGDDFGRSVAVNVAGSAYVTGAAGANFPTLSPLPTPLASVGFVTKFTPSGAVVYSTLLSGVTASSGSFGIAVDDAGNAFATGSTNAAIVTTAGAFQTDAGFGGTVGWVTVIADPTIIGRVSDENGNPLPGATVNLTGVPSATTTTDANGGYTFGLLTVGNSYTVTVVVPNYIFGSAGVNNLQKNVRRDFGPDIVSISGHVTLNANGLSGVTMTLSGGKASSVTTGAFGDYAINNLPAGRNYTVTPTINLFQFTPPNRSFSNVTTNQTADFVATGIPIVFVSPANTTVSEGVGAATITVMLSGDTSLPSAVDFATSDTAGLQSCTVVNGKASERCDYETTVGTLRFDAGETSKSFIIPIVNDGHVEGDETFTVTLSNPSGAIVGGTNPATVTILDNDSAGAANPIDGVDFFVTQQYIDFLGRLPDTVGFANWVATLGGCPNGGFGEPATSDCDRLHVAAGFFQSDEFLNRGYWAFCFYMVSYNQRPTYAQFIPDMAQVGGPKSPAEEQASKAAFSDAFVLRPEFVTKYPGLSGQPLANALWLTAGLPGSPITAGSMTKGQILRAVVETSAAFNKFLTDGTVAIQYFGFLRRDPDTIGYQNNLTTLRSDPNNLRHMIFIFIYSSEYRGRFGTP